MDDTALYQHASWFAGQPVVQWNPDSPEVLQSSNAYRIELASGPKKSSGVFQRLTAGFAKSMGYKWSWTETFAAFVQTPGLEDLTWLVVGLWGDGASSTVVQSLVSIRSKLPNLKGVFLGDILREESEISWIKQSNVSSIFTAFPNLEYLTIRGGTDLSLGSLQATRLRYLILQSAGLSRDVVKQVAQAELPAIEHLELWLGDEEYGGDAIIDDIRPLLELGKFPRLKYLGLRNAQFADEIAVLAASSPVLQQLDTLDLSLGTLGDDGARALLSSPYVKGLKKLDVHHNFCSIGIISELERLPGDVDASDALEVNEDEEEKRYVAVSE